MRSFLAVVFLAGPLTGCGESSEEQPDAGRPIDPVIPSALLDGGGGVPIPENGELSCPMGACNYQSGTGCGPGEACRPTANGNLVRPACVPAGSSQEGEACAADGDCAALHFCASRVCRRMCCGDDWTVCPDGRSCFVDRNVSLDGSAVPTGAATCAPSGECDLLEPEAGCEAGSACLVVDSRGAGACLPPGDGEAADPCPCAGGFVCATGTCRRLCRAGGDGGGPFCPPGEGVCVHFDRNADGVGECTPLRR